MNYNSHPNQWGLLAAKPLHWHYLWWRPQLPRSLAARFFGGYVYQTSNADITKAFNKNARIYDRWIGLFERYVADGARVWAISKAQGTVVEIGVGSGLNLPLYSPKAQHVTGIELSEKMLTIARSRLAGKGIDRIELRYGDAQILDLPSESADTFISTFTFCSIPDPLSASREAYRVLRPGGVFVLAEHGYSTGILGRAIMHAIEPLSILVSAEHITRNPVSYLTGAGFTITHIQRSGPGGIVFRMLAAKQAPTQTTERAESTDCSAKPDPADPGTPQPDKRHLDLKPERWLRFG
ncbi:class I SAM-dependent methyltransferase [Pseudarthrobacter sp. NamE2]|uniref:class I SAM-dependent methyltransferase n=1 Tax=Pseudarthrobacter sp. NamE2 TaxID=2576838 RepID=UPI00197A73CC|nr:class I SAM-dependent methyltransferase [Pseudarthrobacter sp. NamE2]